MRSYNPLSVNELGQNAARALMGYPAVPLPPAPSFEGAGVYTIHYDGSFSAYAGIRAEEPIYVGKALTSDSRSLYERLSKHATSIKSAENLDLADFHCRWLVLDRVWVGLTEQVLIDEYRPLWNVVVAGFGINAPGKGRKDQRKSQWDTLHPGRSYAADLPPRKEAPDDILRSIYKHRETPP